MSTLLCRFCVTFGVILCQLFGFFCKQLFGCFAVQLFGRRVIKRGEQPPTSSSKVTFSKKFADFEEQKMASCGNLLL